MTKIINSGNMTEQMAIDKLVAFVRRSIKGRFTGTLEIKFFEGGISKVYQHKEVKLGENGN